MFPHATPPRSAGFLSSGHTTAKPALMLLPVSDNDGKGGGVNGHQQGLQKQLVERAGSGKNQRCSIATAED